jgi:hypothetical protein
MTGQDMDRYFHGSIVSAAALVLAAHGGPQAGHDNCEEMLTKFQKIVLS